MKKIFSLKKTMSLLLAAILLVLSMSTNTFAAENDSTELLNVGTEISSSGYEINPNSISTYDLGIPDASKCINLNEESLHFYGDAVNSTLYSNYNFTGKCTVSYLIQNTGDKTLTVKVYNRRFPGIVKKTIKVAPNSTQSGSFNGLDRAEKYYIAFKAPSHFSGSFF